MPDQTTAVPLPEPLVMVNRYGHAASTADGDGGLFTAAQLLAYGDRRAAEAVERATVACMRIANDLRNHEVVRMTASKCAAAIRKGD